MLMKSACSIAFFGFLRCGGFTVLKNFDHTVNLTRCDVTLSTDKVVLMLKQSKTDPFRHGVRIPIHATNCEVCPVAAMRLYLQERDSRFSSTKQALFIDINGHALTRTVYITFLKQLLRKIGLNVNHYNGHSMRKVLQRRLVLCALKTI